MVIWRFYSNVSVPDTLAVTGGGNLSNSATSIQAGSGAPVGYPTSYPFLLRLEPATSSEELVLVTAGAGTVATPWTISRGQDGSTAKTHAAGTALAHGFSATDFSTAATHYNQGSGSGVHGLPTSAWSAGSFATIQETSTTANQTSISFSSIPQTYKHLLLVGTGRLAETTVQSDDVTIQFNGDSSSVYSFVTMILVNSGGTFPAYSGGSTPGPPSVGNGFAAANSPLFRLMASQAGAPANVGGGFAVVPNYTSSTLNKVFYSFSGGGNGTSSFMDMRLRIGVYNPTSQAAVTALTVTAPGTGLNSGGLFCLYGFG